MEKYVDRIYTTIWLLLLCAVSIVNITAYYIIVNAPSWWGLLIWAIATIGSVSFTYYTYVLWCAIITKTHTRNRGLLMDLLWNVANLVIFTNICSIMLVFFLWRRYVPILIECNNGVRAVEVYRLYQSSTFLRYALDASYGRVTVIHFRSEEELD